MSDWPDIGNPSEIFISPFSLQAQGVEYAALAAAAPSSVAWATINLVRLYPFVLSEPMLIKKLWIYKGATVTGNMDVGIYTGEPAEDVVTRLTSAGTTAVAATASILQEVDITDLQLGRGRYYMAALMSLTTTTMFCNALPITQGKLMGLATGGSGNAALPATITLAAVVDAIQPVFGCAGRTLVL